MPLIPLGLQVCVVLLCVPMTKCVNYDSFEVRSIIQTRFCVTTIVAHVSNNGDRDETFTIPLLIPKDAFVTNFTFSTNDATVVGKMVTSDTALSRYQAARGRGAVLEFSGAQSFNARISLAASTRAVIQVSYDQVLRRSHGLYRHSILITEQMAQADQIVISSITFERTDITDIHVPEYGSDYSHLPNSEVLKYVDASDVVISKNVRGEWTRLSVEFEPHSAGNFVLLYDVQRDYSGGQIETVDGYFVHFFVPPSEPPLSKQVIFVLDKSGSMTGRKFEQVRLAMSHILSDLSESDAFNIVTFETEVRSWKLQPAMATQANIDEALGYLDQVTPSGLTNLFDAVLIGLDMLYQSETPFDLSAVFLLTDGRQTSSLKTTSDFEQLLAEVNPSQLAVHGVAFGHLADYALLQGLASATHGVARRIYFTLDAAAQLQGFFNEAMSPVLRNLTVTYTPPPAQMSGQLWEERRWFSAGEELVVVGRLPPQRASGSSMRATVSAVTADRRRFRSNNRASAPAPLPPEALPDFVEKMWAHVTIESALEGIAGVPVFTAEKLTNQIIYLSVKYNIVTPFTSIFIDLKDVSLDEPIQSIAPDEPTFTQAETKTVEELKLSAAIASERIWLNGRAACSPSPIVALVDLSGSAAQTFMNKELLARVLVRLSARLDTFPALATPLAIVALDAHGRGRTLHPLAPSASLQTPLDRLRQAHVPQRGERAARLLRDGIGRARRPVTVVLISAGGNALTSSLHTSLIPATRVRRLVVVSLEKSTSQVAWQAFQRRVTYEAKLFTDFNKESDIATALC